MGLAAVAFTVIALSTVAIGLGRWLAHQHDAQPRSAVAFAAPPANQAWNAPSNIGRTAQLAIVASLSLPAAASPAPEPDPHAALAFAKPEEAIVDPDVTGSLGNRAFKLASADTAPAILSANLATRSAQPLPPPRPRLAALTPTGRLGVEPEPDARFLRTAIYDITAQVVYLPNGERLEAHSGLGPYMDNPRHVHLRMRGATPPNTYKLRLRERLFHGVRAIRLTPENEADMFGRDGILAHSYMLGPNGQSNGCVSFKDYPRFLRAFLRGEIDRMIVVTRLDKPPTFFARRDTKSASSAF